MRRAPLPERSRRRSGASKWQTKGPGTCSGPDSAFCHNGYGTERIGSKKDKFAGRAEKLWQLRLCRPLSDLPDPTALAGRLRPPSPDANLESRLQMANP